MAEDKSTVDIIEEEVYEELLACVTGIVWNDFNKDGIKNEDEKGIDGVKVTIYTAKTNEATEHSGITDSEGEYLIENIEPGEYYAVFDPGSDYEFILQGELVDSLGRSKPFTLKEGETNNRIAAPLIRNAGIIKGSVFKEIELNKQDIDIALKGQGVILVDENGKRTEKTTNDLGMYAFTGLVDGKYTVVFKNSEEYICITPSAKEITIKNGLEVSHINALYERINNNFYIEGRVFVEKNITGFLSVKDTLVNGIIVELYKNEVLIKRTLTETINGIMGIYRFSNLLPDVYEVKFILPPGGGFGKRNNMPYGSKVNEETGVVKINLQSRDEVDVNASIIIK